jgi:hypothetical protein
MAHVPTEPRRVIGHTGQPCNILIPFDPILTAEELAQALSSKPDPTSCAPGEDTGRKRSAPSMPGFEINPTDLGPLKAV